MTGFGRAEGTFDGAAATDGASWVWELRAVNGKGLDIRMRLPPGFERLEHAVRKTCGEQLSRGNVQATLTLSRGKGAAVPIVNTGALDAVLAAIGELEENATIGPSSAAEILSLRGVMEVAEPQLDDDATAKLDAALLEGLNGALVALKNHRATEGAALAGILSGHLDATESLTARAENDPARTREAIAARVEEQLARITDGGDKFDRDRLHQEVALLATKADIREELDRLTAHIAAARDLIGVGSPAGRKLEFLAQEFNRESNTLCSKSNAVSLTEIGLELKVVIDQFREQILNVE